MTGCYLGNKLSNERSGVSKDGVGSAFMFMISLLVVVFSGTLNLSFSAPTNYVR